LTFPTVHKRRISLSLRSAAILNVYNIRLRCRRTLLRDLLASEQLGQMICL